MIQVPSIKFSIIIPVYNRPEEVAELLESLTRQTFKDFEVIIVEDGSSVLSEKVCRGFMDKLYLKYYYKENTGPGTSRNYGMQRASGNYFIILDSDVILPENYLQTIHKKLSENYVDAFGGPDTALPDFTPVQKAINFAMTSFLTTGGIRGKSEKVEKFHLRSFNMGISKGVFQKTGGFSKLRFGEDIDLSIRIIQQGFKTALIPEAFVYHKRRNTFKSFFKQVYNSGIARINLYKLHPNSLKPAHFFPALFTIGFFLAIISTFFRCYLPILFYFFYTLLIFISAFMQYKNIKTAFLSVLATFIMLFGYGIGFIKAFIKIILLKQKSFTAFDKSFYD